MSYVIRKPAFRMCENKGAEQLHGNRPADQHFNFATEIVQSLFFPAPIFSSPEPKAQR